MDERSQEPLRQVLGTLTEDQAAVEGLLRVPPSVWQAEMTRRAQAEAELGNTAQIDAFKRQCDTLIGFTEYRFPRYRVARHHQLIAEQLERVERGEIDRLMLLIPPRHGKSELASKSMPAWSIGRQPWRQFISASASIDLARDWGREVRNIVDSDAYQSIYGTRLQEDSKAAGKWNTQQGGCYYAVGVGGSPLGRGADIFLIDDPFGSMEDARSPKIRENVWNWYTGTVYNRLQKDGAIILINHRMHEDDLSGRLIEQMKAGKDQWTIVELPAFAVDHDREGHPVVDPIGRKAGEPLWPEEYDTPRLERRRDNTLARFWSAMFQQQPVPDEGELFAPDKLSVRQNTDDVFQWVRAWDLAGSVEGDWTCGVRIGRTKTGLFVVGDVVRMRGTPEKVQRLILETARADLRRTRISLPKDPGQAGLFQVEALTRALAGYPVVSSPETGDKQQRAEPFAVQVNIGNVAMIEADWNAAYREELRAFPYGKWDDQVDASSRAFMELTSGRQPMIISKEALERA